MAAYLIIHAEVSADADLRSRYRQYQTEVQPLIATHGGRLRANGIDGELLEGGRDARRLMLFEFPSMDAIHAFWRSPRYAEVKQLRAGAARVEVWAVPEIAA